MKFVLATAYDVHCLLNTVRCVAMQLTLSEVCGRIVCRLAPSHVLELQAVSQWVGFSDSHVLIESWHSVTTSVD